MTSVVKHLHRHLMGSGPSEAQLRKRVNPASSSPSTPPRDDQDRKAALDDADRTSGTNGAPKAALTVGCFDVCHRGHKNLIDRLLTMGDVVSVGWVTP